MPPFKKDNILYNTKNIYQNIKVLIFRILHFQTHIICIKEIFSINTYTTDMTSTIKNIIPHRKDYPHHIPLIRFHRIKKTIRFWRIHRRIQYFSNQTHLKNHYTTIHMQQDIFIPLNHCITIHQLKLPPPETTLTIIQFLYNRITPTIIYNFAKPINCFSFTHTDNAGDTYINGRFRALPSMKSGLL